MSNLIQFVLPKRAIYEIDLINKNIGRGSTHPVLVRASNKRDYILKTKFDDYGFYKSVFCELLAYEIAKILGYEKIMPGNPVLLNIDELTWELAEEAFSNKLISDVSLKNILRSKGVNIGIPYIPESQITNSISNAEFAKQTVFVDSYMINMDRRPTNPNIIYCTKEKRYYAIDFGYSLYWHLLFKHIEDGSIREFIDFNDDVFYQDLGDSAVIYLEKYKNCNWLKNVPHCTSKFQKGLRMPREHKSIDELKIRQIIGNFPEDWSDFSNVVVDDIADVLGARIGNRKVIRL